MLNRRIGEQCCSPARARRVLAIQNKPKTPGRSSKRTSRAKRRLCSAAARPLRNVRRGDHSRFDLLSPGGADLHVGISATRAAQRRRFLGTLLQPVRQTARKLRFKRQFRRLHLRGIGSRVGRAEFFLTPPLAEAACQSCRKAVTDRYARRAWRIKRGEDQDDRRERDRSQPQIGGSKKKNRKGPPFG